MGVSVDDIKKLRELTGVGLTDAKKALVEAEGDFDKALEAMRKKGLTKAEKKGDREAREGQLKKHFAEQVLMSQSYILDDSKTVEQHVKEAIAKLGENIVVRQFKRIELGVSE